MNFPPPFPLSAFITSHSLSLPFIAAPSHCPPTLCSPVLSSPRPVLSSPRPVSSSPCPVLSSSRPALSPRPAFPRFTLASLLLHHPLCFTHPSFTHHCLRSFVLLPFFYSLCFTPSIVFTLSHCFTSFVLFFPPLLYSLHCFTPLCFAHSIVLHRFALLSTIVYPPFALLSPIVYTPFALFTPIVLHPFFYSPATSANPSLICTPNTGCPVLGVHITPAPQKATFFSFFKEIL